MCVLVVDPSAPEGARVTEIAEPVAGGDRRASRGAEGALDFGDLTDARSGRVPPGAVLGWDLAGIVLRSGPTGPRSGTQVVALAMGAFAEQVAVDPGALAEVPVSVDLAQAAALHYAR
jgi:NADPH:quinone reductase